MLISRSSSGSVLLDAANAVVDIESNTMSIRISKTFSLESPLFKRNQSHNILKTAIESFSNSAKNINPNIFVSAHFCGSVCTCLCSLAKLRFGRFPVNKQLPKFVAAGCHT